MKTPSISLEKTLEITIKDTFQRLGELNDKENRALREEYKEWLEAIKGDTDQPHVLYLNRISSN